MLAVFWAVLAACYASAVLAFAGSILGCAATCCAPPVSALPSYQYYKPKNQAQ